MPTNILMPALSPTMEDGTLAKWLVSEGDTVQSGDLLAEIETDKATMEFEAVDEGIIGKLLIAAGTTGVKVNTPIAVLMDEGENADDIPKPNAPQEPEAAQAVDATPKAAPLGGGAGVAPPLPTIPKGNRVFASPLARRLAADKGVDLGTLTGSGPRGRIVKADILGAKSTPQKTSATPKPVDASQVEKMYQDRDYEVITLDGMRSTIAARLSEAKQTIPHFYLRRSVKLDALLALRSQINGQLADQGTKLSVNDFIIKASALALQNVPAANAVWAGDRVLQMKASDVAVAVAVEGGLFTPVLQDAQTKPLSQLSTDMKDLATRARTRKLAPHEYQGGSFAISNLGMFGIENFDAVINPPHGAILAVGAGVKQPVVQDDGSLGVATVMSLTLSVDHRVIDGAVGAELMGAIVGYLENPVRMLV